MRVRVGVNLYETQIDFALSKIAINSMPGTARFTGPKRNAPQTAFAFLILP